MPVSPLHLILLVIVAVFLVTFIQIGALTIAFEKLGLSPHSASLLFVTLVVGSFINLPLFSVKAEAAPPGAPSNPLNRFFRMPQIPFTGRTLIAVNVGGCVTPLAFSIYLLLHNPVSLFQVLATIAAVATVSHMFSRPMPGIGIGIPILVAPLSAAMTALALNPQMSAPLAWIGGTLGVVIGADVLRLKDIRKMGAPIASIGGAGTFDGILVTGIVAVLLA
jgi:uncharacterized membrane protein